LDLEATEEMKRSLSKKGTVELVWMTPDEFLSEVPHPATRMLAAIRDLSEKWWAQSSIKYLTESIIQQRKLDPLYLDYTTMIFGWPAHEGRHRAYVAKRLGIEKIPVLVCGVASFWR
jgi:hypothetical protein